MGIPAQATSLFQGILLAFVGLKLAFLSITSEGYFQQLLGSGLMQTFSLLNAWKRSFYFLLGFMVSDKNPGVILSLVLPYVSVPPSVLMICIS